MSENIKDKPVIAGALEYRASSTEQNGEPIPNQPKQPSNLQGLLRFAVEATKEEDTSHAAPMDEEKMKFLDSALKSMTVDIIEVLQSQIKVLQKADTLTPESDISEYKEALDTILEYVDNIDTANDFHKIGGFTIFQPCLKTTHPELRAGACGVLAELCQNNPYCQRIVLDNGFVPVLLKTLATDADTQVCVKSLYAISCIVRHNTEGFHQLIQHEGLTVLLKAFQKGDDKLRTKAAFLLSSLCGTQPDLKSRLVFLEYIPVLIAVLAEERRPSHEHILSLLLLLIEDNSGAINECRNPIHNLNHILTNHIQTVHNKPESQEEESYCQQLLNLLFPIGMSNGL